MQAHQLDQRLDVRLRATQAKLAPPQSQPACENGEVEHQRRVREAELGEVDDHVVRRGQGSGKRTAAASGRESILFPRHAQDSELCIERDDPGKLANTPGYTQPPMVDEEDITEALSNVIDPELGLDFVELGLIYGVEVSGGRVDVTFTLTTPACPIGPQVSEQIVEFVGELDGVDEVVPTMTFTPPWTPDKMSEDAKFALGY